MVLIVFVDNNEALLHRRISGFGHIQNFFGFICVYVDFLTLRERENTDYFQAIEPFINTGDMQMLHLQFTI